MRVSSRVYLTTGSGSVLMSDDGGQTWRDISAGAGIDGHAGFATVDRAGCFWATEDGSNRLWRRLRDGKWIKCATPHNGVSGIAVDPQNANWVFVISSGGALARSNDAGAHWTDWAQP
jgi:photosystem II stability/assembly factor-like uncharacterized protein